MNELIKEIEDRINEYKSQLDKFSKMMSISQKQATGFFKRMDELKWVLSKLKKMNCDNCMHKKICYKWIHDKEYNYKKLTFCSKWISNEKQSG